MCDDLQDKNKLLEKQVASNRKYINYNDENIDESVKSNKHCDIKTLLTQYKQALESNKPNRVKSQSYFDD